jgi:inosine-uridine nucleoside N-ribohydrolase
MHDPLAVAAALYPDILETHELHIDVLTDGPDRGRTVRVPVREDAPAGGRGVRVAFGHDVAAFRRLLDERVLTPLFGAKQDR